MESDLAQQDNSRYRAVVSDVVAAARKKVGGSEALSVRLLELGVKSERGDRYSVSAVSNWVQGRTMPPADVFLAVADVGDQSIDSAVGAVDQDLVVDELRSTVARLQAEMANLHTQLDIPYGGDQTNVSD